MKGLGANLHELSSLPNPYHNSNYKPFFLTSILIGASTRLFGLLDESPPLDEEAGRRLEAVQGRLTFNDLRLSYLPGPNEPHPTQISCRFSYPARPDVEILKGLSLEVEPGQVQAIVGSSGSGKSTLGALLLRLYKPSGGSIALDGVDLKDLEAHWLRESVAGIVSQEPVLFDGNNRQQRHNPIHDATLPRSFDPEPQIDP